MNKIWKKISIITDRKYEEPISEILNSIRKDGILINQNENEITLIQFIPEEEFSKELLETIKGKIRGLFTIFDKFDYKLEIDEIEEENWAENWKVNFKPLRIGKKIIIYPSWEKPLDIKEDDILIQMDPGGAFGTGLHETTKLCSSVIEEIMAKEEFERMIDIGCGTGILSFIASKLGVKKIVATDIDKHAIEVTIENSEINNVTNVEAVHSDLMKNLPKTIIKDGFDLVVANILLNTVTKLIPHIASLMKKNGKFALSGITVDQIPIVKDIMIKENLKFIEDFRMNNWAVIIGTSK